MCQSMEISSKGSGYLTNLRINGVLEAKRIEWKQSMKMSSTGIEADGVQVAKWGKTDRWTIEKHVSTGGNSTVNRF